MMMRILWMFFFAAILPVAAQSSTVIEKMSADTPSLETAYPGKIVIERSIHGNGDLVDYNVEITAPEVLDSWLHAAIVVRDPSNRCLFRGMIEVRRITKSNKQECRSFSFSVHSSTEATTLINLGRPTSMRSDFRAFRLPMKSIGQETPR